jgi:DNA invertase Pin-like site-specific DNA recombinase
MRVALYCRVSTDGQDHTNQLLQLREFATSQGWQIVAEYADYESGANSDREQFQAMFKAASQRRFDVLVFWSLDRLSREGALETLTHLNRLTGYGVAYRSFVEPYLDSCGMFKDAVIGILAVIAKQERVRRSERTRAGLARVKAQGRVLGRPRLAVSREEVLRLRSEGESNRAIGRAFGISDGSVRRLLSATA